MGLGRKRAKEGRVNVEREGVKEKVAAQESQAAVKQG